MKLAEFLGLKENVIYTNGANKYKIIDNDLYYSIITNDWIKHPIFDVLKKVKEEPKFYAKLKGWELIDSKFDVCWGVNDGVLDLWHKCNDTRRIIELTKSEWNDLGINDTNADFEEVE